VSFFVNIRVENATAFEQSYSVMASGRVRTGIQPGTNRHLSIPRSGRSGFEGIRSIPWLPHQSVPKSSRLMPVLDHSQTGSIGPA